MNLGIFLLLNEIADTSKFRISIKGPSDNDYVRIPFYFNFSDCETNLINKFILTNCSSNNINIGSLLQQSINTKSLNQTFNTIYFKVSPKSNNYFYFILFFLFLQEFI